MGNTSKPKPFRVDPKTKKQFQTDATIVLLNGHRYEGKRVDDIHLERGEVVGEVLLYGGRRFQVEQSDQFGVWAVRSDQAEG